MACLLLISNQGLRLLVLGTLMSTARSFHPSGSCPLGAWPWNYLVSVTETLRYWTGRDMLVPDDGKNRWRLRRLVKNFAGFGCSLFFGLWFCLFQLKRFESVSTLRNRRSVLLTGFSYLFQHNVLYFVANTLLKFRMFWGHNLSDILKLILFSCFCSGIKNHSSSN